MGQFKTTIHGLVHEIIELCERFQIDIDEGDDPKQLQKTTHEFNSAVQKNLARITGELDTFNKIDEEEDVKGSQGTGD
jgi:hypothetical protein